MGDRMTRQQPTLATEPRQVEPEVIPPGERDTYSGGIWVVSGGDRVVHVRIARPGPLGVLIALLLISAAAAALLLVTGFALIGVAAAGLFIVGATVWGLLRRLFRQ
jgi:hypothetical protein